jgi:Domain of unknown function (DUF4349)
MSLPDSLVAELAGASVAASPELRARVREIAARAPEPRPRRVPRLAPRRAALALAGAVVVAALGAALAGGLVSSTRSTHSAALPARLHGEKAALPPRPSSTVEQGVRGFGVVTVQGGPLQTLSPVGSAPVDSAATLAPTTGRAQQYDAEMQLRVKDLSSVTQRALRLTRALGGYVRSVDYGAGTKSGNAELVVRIPLGAVQKAIVRFSALGAIIDQHVSIQDVQAAFDRRFRQLQALRAQITAAQRAGNQTKVARLRKQLLTLERLQAQAKRRDSYATLSLGLTTAKPVVAHPKPGRVDRALDSAGSILLKELVVLLYVLIVAGPIALLAGLGLAVLNLRRRRSTERLLARQA